MQTSLEPPPGSYWAATAGPPPPLSTLASDIETDVLIIGGGFTGLSAAYHLSKHGLQCALIEANGIGWGASGRTGGIAIPRYKHTFPEIDARYGRKAALDLYQLAHSALSTLEQIITDCGMDCGFARYGHITPVVHERDEKRFATDVRWLADQVGDTNPSMLGRAELEERIGTKYYAAGYFEPRAGGIHPLKYCHGLARALVNRGVRLFVGTPAVAWQRDATGVTVETPNARIRAKQLLIATNAYSDLAPGTGELKPRVVPMVSSLIATVPLTGEIGKSVLRYGNLVTDAKRLTNYYRMTPCHRLLFGGRGGATNRESASIYARLERDMAAILPPLRGTPIEYRWSGRVAVTLDGLPHAGALNERVFYAMGYNGRGVVLSAFLGHVLAQYACGDAVALGPLTNTRFEPIPFHLLRVPAKQLAITYFQLLDALGV
jgi:gamma-glutamylputrescine oxidase